MGAEEESEDVVEVDEVVGVVRWTPIMEAPRDAKPERCGCMGVEVFFWVV